MDFVGGSGRLVLPISPLPPVNTPNLRAGPTRGGRLAPSLLDAQIPCGIHQVYGWPPVNLADFLGNLGRLALRRSPLPLLNPLILRGAPHPPGPAWLHSPSRPKFTPKTAKFTGGSPPHPRVGAAVPPRRPPGPLPPWMPKASAKSAKSVGPPPPEALGPLDTATFILRASGLVNVIF